ncbi:MAG: alpha-L-fucosidase [Anaerolineae bacterium]|nr:alpha-L-fucosidase [Anaerolineae bacterium]
MLKPKPTSGDSSWFTHNRFGMFIHWGLYALPARHEWVKSREEISDENYQPYFDHFNPTLYDPQQWARTAREAGMKYVVITTKHHEGFCLWDTHYTDYKVTNTPYGKDLIAPFVDAFRAEGLHIGFYYSLLDWHHPDFPIDVYHPLRNHPDAAEMNKSRDMTVYAEYMRNQMRELLTNFGQIDELFCDFSYPDRVYQGLPGKGRADWESEKLVKLIRELQPKIMLNNRLDLPDAADFYTPEQIQPPSWIHINGQPVLWETCQTFSGSWGYHRDEETWKSPSQLIRMLVNTVACGGNLLMNVGPTARGTFDQRALDALAVYRDWLAVNSDSIYGCTQSEFTAPPDCRLTQNGKKLYAHVFAWPFIHLLLAGLTDRVEYAQFLHDGSEILMNAIPDWQLEHMQIPQDTLVLTLPIKKPNVVVPVIELTLK